MTGGALQGLVVLDFTTLLPGPLATAMLASAGAEVVKIERPEGDGYRVDPPAFALLNAGKRSIAVDLKRDAARLRPLIERCDVVVEQFRPGVMERLGLGYDAVRTIRPSVIYVSINGYGSHGADALRPGHDLTFQAESGLLSLNADASGAPVVPAAMVADIAAGQAAFANIALALYARARSGAGARIEVPMLAAVLPYLIEPIAHATAVRVPVAGYSPATGGSPRYGIYPCADGRHLAVASPEDKFWRAFVARVGLPPEADRAAVAARLLERGAADWMIHFAGADLCCSPVLTVTEALATPRIRALLDAEPLPFGVARAFRRDVAIEVPVLGEANVMLA